MSPSRTYRLWRAAGQQVPRKRPRKRMATVRPRPQAPTGPNQVWSYDFVFDHCANGQKLKCLTVTDEFTKSCEESIWRGDAPPARWMVQLRNSQGIPPSCRANSREGGGEGVCPRLSARSRTPFPSGRRRCSVRYRGLDEMGIRRIALTGDSAGGNWRLFLLRASLTKSSLPR
jgi:hypothetical protein